MRERLLAQRLLLLFAAGWVLLDFPWLRIFERDARWLGLPLLPVALFVLWGLLIAVLAWLVESRRDDDPGGDGGRD